MAAAERTPGAGDSAAGLPSLPRDPGHLPPAGNGQAWLDAVASDIDELTVLGSVAPVPQRVKLSILMPVYNEEKTVALAVSELLQTEYPCDVELIIIDDGSTDRTAALLAAFDDPRVQIHRHTVNRGKGAAIMTAVSLATGTHILPFDADLEYSADDINRMLMPVLKGRVDVVYGTRLFGVNTVYRSYRYALGNRLLSNMANVLFNAWITDLHTCFKLIPVTLIRAMNLRERGFGLDTELTALLLRQGTRPFEVPVSYYGRSHAQGKKITWRDGLTCARVLLSVRVRTRAQMFAPGTQAAGRPAVETDPASAAPASLNGHISDDGDEITASMG